MMKSFSELNTGVMPALRPASIEATCAWLLESISAYQTLLRRSLWRWLDERALQTAQRLTGLIRNAPDLLASNLRLRAGLGLRLIDIADQLETGPSGPLFFLVTLISDRWVTTTAESTLYLKAMQDAIRQTMLRGEFDGWFGMIEVQTVDHLIGRGLGRPMQPHAHFLAWSRDRAFDIEAAEARMCAEGRGCSVLGARYAVIKPNLDGDVWRIAAYVMKAQALAKYMVRSNDTPSGFTYADCVLPPVCALRQAEVLSGVEFIELMLSGGEGAKIRSELKRWMRTSFYPTVDRIEPDAALDFWRRQRERTWLGRYYGEVDILRAGRPLPTRSPVAFACAGYDMSRYPRLRWQGVGGQVPDGAGFRHNRRGL